MSELFPAKSIAIEVVGCTDPTQMREFSRWFDLHYVPELMRTPGVVDVYRYLDMQADFGPIGARFMAPKEAPPRYLTLYRIDDDDPWAVTQKITGDHERRRAEGSSPTITKATPLPPGISSPTASPSGRPSTGDEASRRDAGNHTAGLPPWTRQKKRRQRLVAVCPCARPTRDSRHGAVPALSNSRPCSRR